MKKLSASKKKTRAAVEARQLVRGYRSIDLRAEIEGASSLLTAAGIDTEVIGSPDAVQAEFAEAAEGGGQLAPEGIEAQVDL